MHVKKIINAAIKPQDAKKAVIMIHGRGGSADDILSLAGHLNMAGAALIAPEATNNTWYPFSFLAPPQQNEPWLSSALQIIKDIVNDLKGHGIEEEQIYFVGFSQGACLTLEFVARNAAKWGGVVAFTGGLIGDRVYKENYSGDFQQTKIFIGTSDPDPHVPVARVEESVEILKALNADVTLQVYKNMGHTINEDEISKANTVVFGRSYEL
jgi:phospholipase/carboxylesterase